MQAKWKDKDGNECTTVFVHQDKIDEAIAKLKRDGHMPKNAKVTFDPPRKS